MERKIDWKRKLSSRKFWAAVVAWLTSVLTLFNVDGNTTAQIAAVVMGVGSLCVYMLAEGLADCKRGTNGGSSNNDEGT